MIKKNRIGKIFLNGCLLSIFFIMLLGCFTCSFAEFTDADIKNIFYYYYHNDIGWTDQEIDTYLSNIDFSNIRKTSTSDSYVDITNYFNNDNYDIYVYERGSGSSRRVNIGIAGINTSKVITCTTSNTYYVVKYVTSIQIVPISSVSDEGIRLTADTTGSNGSTISSNTTTPIIWTNVFNVDKIGNNNDVIHYAPYSNPSGYDPLNGPYTDAYNWGVALNLYNNMYISGDNVFSIIGNNDLHESLYYSEYCPDDCWSVFWLGGAKYFDHTYFEIYRFNKFSGRWELRNTTNIHNIWAYDDSNDTGFVYLPDWFYADSIVKCKTFGVGQTAFDYYIYCKSDYTIINNGYIDIRATINNYPSGFSYDSNTNTIDQQITDNTINNIDDNSQKIVEALTSTSISSGNEPKFDDLPSVEVDDDSEEFFTWLSSEIIRVLEDDSNTTLTIPILTEEFEIESDFFVLEDGILRTFISVGWWFIVGVPFLRYIRSSVEKLKGGEIPGADDKNDLLNHIL